MFNRLKAKSDAMAPHMDIHNLDASNCKLSTNGETASSINWEDAIHAANFAILVEGCDPSKDIVAMDVIDRRHIAAISLAIRNEVERQYRQRSEGQKCVLIFDKTT